MGKWYGSPHSSYTITNSCHNCVSLAIHQLYFEEFNSQINFASLKLNRLRCVQKLRTVGAYIVELFEHTGRGPVSCSHYLCYSDSCGWCSCSLNRVCFEDWYINTSFIKTCFGPSGNSSAACTMMFAYCSNEWTIFISSIHLGPFKCIGYRLGTN